MQIQLSWEDPITEEQQELIFPLPLALGRELAQLPQEWQGQEVARAVFASQEISRYHALVYLGEDGQVIYEDRSANGSRINGEKIRQARRVLQGGEVVELGPYSITVGLVSPRDPNATLLTGTHRGTPTLLLEPRTDLIRPATQPDTAFEVPPASTVVFAPEQLPEVRPGSDFPPPDLFRAEQIALSALKATGLPVEETLYLALGGGIGSFVWVDTLRIYGVRPEHIRVISIARKPYERYERLLTNCQIPRWKRIRSGSDSCPDNIWGWPGYALRDAWRSFFSGRLLEAFGFLWQVFSEPLLADTYTPRAGDVFASMDREAARIGWEQMLCYGHIRAIRKTEDGRYVVAYSATRPGHTDHRFMVAKYLHLATGYPAIKLLNDLQEFREKTGDLRSVVHGYEPHDHVYEQLEKQGGTVLIRGFGIVASQVMERLYEARKVNPRISVVHLSRAPKSGNRFGRAKRAVDNHWEFQPFNWPKGTWGGVLRAKLEAATPLERRELLEAWGGTTTASRRKWRRIVRQGLREGWYSIVFGKVESVVPGDKGKPVTYIRGTHNNTQLKVEADFVIDCTGLVSDPMTNPLLNDLITHYNLPLNPHGRLHVSNDFELVEMRNRDGRMYAAGIITLGGPYAPVDTFLGLQYCAHRSVEHLARLRAPGVKGLEGIRSLWQWCKWALNISP
ncbi:FHA domain-containing protein [Synechococcus sp. R55.3]|uniref:FHA domain-containing protein n=2 Tax=unclassified Synechococcus TaxID=2626047 RepID=UPI0039C047B1